MKIKIYVETNKVGSRQEWIEEIDDEDLVDLTEQEKEKHINDIVDFEVQQKIDYSWYEV